MALAPLLQIRIIVRNRDAGGTSPAWVSIMLIGFLLWLAYGLVNQALPLVITNTVSVLIATALLVTIRRFRGRASTSLDARSTSPEVVHP